MIQLQAQVAQLEQENAELRQNLKRSVELETRNRLLESRDCILEATANVATALLTVEDFDAAVNTALKIIGECLETDRVSIIENIDRPFASFPDWKVLYEWNAPGIPCQLLHPNLVQGNYGEIPEWYHLLEQGQGVSGLVEETPESFRSGQIEIGVKSLHVIPIWVEGKFWGVVGIDDCRVAKHRSLSELAVLKIAAACIGNAIQHERIQQNLIIERAKAAEERAAEFAKANTAMRRSIDQLARDPNLSAFLGHVLQEITLQFDADAAQIFIYNPEERTLCASVGLIDDKITFSPPYVSKFSVDTWSGWAIMTQLTKPKALHPEIDAHLFLPEYLDYHRSRGHRGIVCALLTQGAEPIGFIGFACCCRETFSDEELELVQSLSQQATLAIQLTRLAEDAKQAAVLDERNRMARDIHDTLAQAFTGVIVQLEATKRKIGSTQFEAAQEHIARARNLATAGLSEARRSVRALRPEALESDDLPNALRHLTEQMACDTNIQVVVQIEGVAYALNADIETHLLRIGQEALTNALRHAQAQTIRLELLFEASVVHLHVIDDGQGFDPKSQISTGFGLISMQERSQHIGGQFMLTSKVGEGTAITVSVPINVP